MDIRYKTIHRLPPLSPKSEHHRWFAATLTELNITGSVIQSDKQTPPLLPPKMTPPQNFFVHVSEHFRPKKKCFEKFKCPITPEILISQKISLISKLFRLKRSTKKVSCVFSEKLIFKNFKFRVWTQKKLSSLQKYPRPVSLSGEAGLEPLQELGPPAGVKAPRRG